MKVMIIRPAMRNIESVDAKEVHEAYARAGLEGGHLDHGVVRRADGDEPGLGIFVHQWSLTRDQDKQSYFILGGKLYGGNAVVYGFDQVGVTVNCPQSIGPILWVADQHEVERMIRAGQIERPVNKENDQITWRWPERDVRGEE